MDDQTTQLLTGAVVGAVAGYLLKKPVALGALLGAAGGYAWYRFGQAGYDAGGGLPLPALRTFVVPLPRPSIKPPARALRTLMPTRVVPPQTPPDESDPEVGWVGEEALDPIHRALWAVDHGDY